ncbi:hypothetical protein RSAG8_08181, partial [Rhizoctonia solani AG-8 WAC10335]
MFSLPSGLSCLPPIKVAAVIAGLDKGDNYSKIRRSTGVLHGTITNIRSAPGRTSKCPKGVALAN